MTTTKSPSPHESTPFLHRMKALLTALTGNGIVGNVSKISATTAIISMAMYLVYQLAGSLPHLTVQADKLVQDHMDIRETVRGGNEQMIKLLRGVCLNSADTKEDSARCNP